MSSHARHAQPARASHRHEKRTRTRVTFNRRICALILGSSLQLVDIQTTDLSTGGLGFTSPIALRVGDILVVAFPRDGMSNLYLCRVRNVRWMKSLCYRVGAEFTGCQRLYSGEESIPLAWFGLNVDADGFSPMADSSRQKITVV
jgi:hypothetical protein